MVAEKILEFHNELEKLKVEFDEVVSLLMKQKKNKSLDEWGDYD